MCGHVRADGSDTLSRLAGAHVLVTGGAGFIGSHLVRALLARGTEVRVLDNFATGYRANLRGLDDAVEIFEGDLRNYEEVHAAMRDIDLVFHQAALRSIPGSIQDPLTTSTVNVEGTLNVLVAARAEGVGRIVNASSSSVYGDGAESPRRESHMAAPLAPYAVSKLAAERYCVVFSKLYGLETISLRYFNVFGPGQDADSPDATVVPRFLRAVAAGKPVTVYGDGAQERDFTYIGDAVAANLAAAEAQGNSGAVVNVGTGQPCTINRLAELVGEAMDKPVSRTHEPSRPGEVASSWAAVDTARELLGWSPRTDLATGLALTAPAESG
jgi:UDP-glucose 4-epimerase